MSKALHVSRKIWISKAPSEEDFLSALEHTHSSVLKVSEHIAYNKFLNENNVNMRWCVEGSEALANEVMINHGTFFYERLNRKFILTVSLYLRSLIHSLCRSTTEESSFNVTRLLEGRQSVFSFCLSRQLWRSASLKCSPGALPRCHRARRKAFQQMMESF